MVATVPSLVSLLAASQCLFASAFAHGAARAPRGRALAAATQRSSQKPRGVAVELYNEASFIYAEKEHIADQGQSFAAKVSVSSEKPIFVLEDFEHLFGGVSCQSDTITLTQPSSSILWQRESFHDLVDGHIITSHVGCNNDHGRLPYQVLSIEQFSDAAVVFVVTPVTWKDSFTTFNIEMGYTDHSHDLRPYRHTQRRVMRRQATGSTAAIPFNASSIPSIGNPTPQQESDSTFYDFDIAESLIQKSLGPFDTPAGQIPVEIGCVNCTTFGTIDVTFASFSWTCGFDPDPSDVMGCLAGGANITTQGLGAHIEMSANLTSDFTFEVPISQIQAKFSIKIPDIGSASVVFGNVVAGGYTLDGSVGMTYGFDLAVPDGSNIMLQVADPSHSSITGFPDSKITALPVQFVADIRSVDLWLALRGIAKAGFEFDEMFDMSGDIGAAVYVDAPVLSANITPVANVDSNCKPLSSAELTGTPGLNVSTSAISVGFSAGWDFGALFEADATILGGQIKADDHSVNEKGSFPIGDVCLDFKNTSSSTVGTAGTNGGSSSESSKTSSAPSPPVWQVAPLLLALLSTSSIFLML